jgi:hypothetical protein
MPGFSWLTRNGGTVETDPEKIKLENEQFEKDLTKRISDTLKTDLGTEINTRVADVLKKDPVLARLAKTMETADQRANEAAEAARVRAEQQAAGNVEELGADMDEGTKKYLDAHLGEIRKSSLRAEAITARSRLFDDSDSFPYYTGEMKNKVDEMLEKEPLENQVIPLVIRNAYKIVVADHMDDITKGKVRSRLAQASGEGTTAGKPSGNTNADELPTLNAEQKKAAAMFGIDEKAYATEMQSMIKEGVL